VVPGFLKEYGSNHLGMNRVELSKMNKRQLKHLK